MSEKECSFFEKIERVHYTKALNIKVHKYWDSPVEFMTYMHMYILQ